MLCFTLLGVMGIEGLVLNCKPDMKEGGDKMEDKQKIEKREQNEGILIYKLSVIRRCVLRCFSVNVVYEVCVLCSHINIFVSHQTRPTSD